MNAKVNKALRVLKRYVDYEAVYHTYETTYFVEALVSVNGENRSYRVYNNKEIVER